jgi:uncharacterized YccA/Bax inhibitor family protein
MLTVNDLLTLGGAAVVVTIVVEVIKRAAAMNDAAIARFGPLLSVAIGVVVCMAAAFAQNASYAEAALTGLLAGATASGIYSFAKGARG